MKIDLFTLANWAAVSSLLILLVLLLRRTTLARQLSRTLCYALWLPVLLRLLLPGQLFSLPIYPQIGESLVVSERLTEANARADAAFSESNLSDPVRQETVGTVAHPDATDSASVPLLPTETAARADAHSLTEWSVPIWMGGALVLAALIAGSNAHFLLFLRRRRTALDGVSVSLPVYTLEHLASPCLAGIFRPAIYLSAEDAQNPRALRHITAHEESHYLGGDHAWSLLRAAALCLHWYNPLVWYAAFLSKRDAELACDERTLRRLGGDERAAYGETLLSLTMAKPHVRDLLSCSTAMVGGKKTLRERIEAIAKSRRTHSAAAFFAVVILAFALVFAFGKQKAGEYDEFLQRVEAAERIASPPGLLKHLLPRANQKRDRRRGERTSFAD